MKTQLLKSKRQPRRPSKSKIPWRGIIVSDKCCFSKLSSKTVYLEDLDPVITYVESIFLFNVICSSIGTACQRSANVAYMTGALLITA